MTLQTRAALKLWFETGDKPTQSQFSDLIDSIPNIIDDAIQLKAVKVSLTAAQVKAGFTTPVEAIANPGAGKAIEVVSASEKLNFGTIAFDNATYSFLKANDVSVNEQASCGNISAGDSRIGRFSIANSGIQVMENKAVMITFDSDSTVGDSTVDYYIVYRIITL
jgi:hypothetical protein